LRRAVVESVLGRPQRLAPPSSIDLTSFWMRFDAVAPLHLRLGFAASVFVLGLVLPLCMLRGPLHRASASAREVVMARADRSGVLSPFVEVAKLVACMAYFDSELVQDGVRGVVP
jgi:hypothetical protein